MKRLWQFFTSLRLTIFLLGSSVLLVFFGTLDQASDGIYLTQKRYFEHFFVVYEAGGLHLPMPGGYLLGPLLILNLLAAHFRYYRAGWRKLGIAALHIGVILLLVGQLLTQVSQRESFMWLAEGEASNYLESFHYDELVVVDRSAPGGERVVSWPEAAFKRTGNTLQHPTLPFTLRIVAYAHNAAISPREGMPQGPDFNLTQGIGADRDFTMLPLSPTYADGERNRKTAIVEIMTSEGSLGRWMVSNVFREKQPVSLPLPAQTFEYAGTEYEIALRFQRHYLPAHLHLLDFQHDRYPGTEIPHNFSSEIAILDPTTENARTTLIYMNNPMRYAGWTFYQASFAENDTMSMFQVVRNPARWFPYLASAVITAGMLYQFIFSLVLYAGRRRPAPAPATSAHPA
ncbi:MAG: cytochrome c biogenesis protein ResB [Opitutales bacterium]